MKRISILSVVLLLLFATCEKDSVPDPNNISDGSTGIAGSMTKFTFVGDYLYVVQNQFLHVYHVDHAGALSRLSSVNLNNSGVETIFSNGRYLFFGTRNGMLIYGLNNPSLPDFVSIYTHVVSCDPVVVKDSIAFVTLSTGNSCGRGRNELEVIDISDIEFPELRMVYDFGNPKGMAISGNYLYLCDAVEGFKVLDIIDYMHIKVKSTLPAVLANDVIVRNNRLTITGRDAVHQYDCTDPLNLKFISKINVQP